MRKTMMACHAALAVAVCVPMLAGGFWITLGNPEASAEARAMNAVVTLMPTGCGNPSAAKVTATAEGNIGGKRTSVPLVVKALSKPGLFAITRQWPAEGKWVLRVVASYEGSQTSALIPVKNSEPARQLAKFVSGAAGDRDVADLLASN
jgi:hypothetical protein